MALAVRRVASDAAPEPVELSSDEMHAVLDDRTREAFGLSADEFVEQLRRGELPTDDSRVDELAVFVGESD